MKEKFCHQCGAKMISSFVDGRIRCVCPACGYVAYEHWRVSAGVRVIVDGKVLLVQRAHDPWKGAWHMPAGYIEVDEVPARAAEREALEETGLTVQAERLLECYADFQDPRGNVLVLLYEASILSGSPRTSPETLSLGFFSPVEAQNLPLAGKSAEDEIKDWCDTHMGDV